MKQLDKDFLPWLSDVLKLLYRLEVTPDDREASLNIPCGDCTLCCQHYRVPLLESEWGHIYKAVEDKPGEWIIPQRPDGSCTHLVDGKCQIYEQRPTTCRMFDCRERIVANLSDKHTREMTLQWDMSRWYKSENRVIITAIRVAARNYGKLIPSTGIAAITSYAMWHFGEYLGAVYLAIEKEKRNED